MASPALSWFLARAREQELRHLAALPAVTIRHAFPDDALALLRLAALDSSEPPASPALVAEVEGELRAALSLRDARVVADPFHRTNALVDLLRARAAQLTADDARPSETPTRRPAGRALRFREGS